MSIARTASQTALPPQASPTSNPSSTFFSVATGYKLFTSSAHSQPDPDQEDVIWHEPEAYSAVISRKEHPRDPTSLLSIREVLRQKSGTDDGGGLPISRFGSIGSSTSRLGVATPPSAWAKPDVQISMEAADGEVSGLPGTEESAGKILHEIESVSAESSRPPSVMSGSLNGSSGFVDAHIRRGHASSLISVDSDMTIGKENGSATKLSVPPAPPPKDTFEPSTEQSAAINEAASQSDPTSTSTFASTLTSSLHTAMRYMLNTDDAPRGASPFPKNHHALLSADTKDINERPHIKYDWTIGKRLKFSCTVYYAKQFDHLRRRCGIDDIFLKSLSRSTNWMADGGKSRSNFRKTSDDQFIIKTLVNAWNVADLYVCLSWFKHSVLNF